MQPTGDNGFKETRRVDRVREGLALDPLIVNFHGIPIEFPRIPRIPDESRGSISPCSPRGTTELTFSSRVSWG